MTPYLSHDELKCIKQRVYHTHLYSDAAFEFLKNFKKYLSSSGHSHIINRTADSMIITREPDNEISIKYNSESYSVFYYTMFYKKHHEFLNWLGWFMKKSLCALHNKIEWNRSNFTNYGQNPFTLYKYDSEKINDSKILSVSDMYLIYDLLRNRKRGTNVYSQTQRDRIIGEPLDPFTAELERARREEIQSLKAELEHQLTLNRTKKYEELNKFQAELDEKYKQINLELNKQFELKINELSAESLNML